MRVYTSIIIIIIMRRPERQYAMRLHPSLMLMMMFLFMFMLMLM